MVHSHIYSNNLIYSITYHSIVNYTWTPPQKKIIDNKSWPINYLQRIWSRNISFLIKMISHNLWISQNISDELQLFLLLKTRGGQYWNFEECGKIPQYYKIPFALFKIFAPKYTFTHFLLCSCYLSNLHLKINQ